jgi:DNA-binding beta-propeller fold protein YncE
VLVALAATGCAGDRPPPEPLDFRAEAAVVVEQRGTQAVALLAGDASGWRIVTRVPVEPGIRGLAWRPDGRLLAVTTMGGNLSNEVLVIDVERDSERVLATAAEPPDAAFFGSVAWSPDGARLAVTRGTGLFGAEVAVLDSATGELHDLFGVGARLDGGVAWSADVAAVLYAAQTGAGAAPAVHRLAVAGGAVSPVAHAAGLDPASGPGGAVAVTEPGGVSIAAGGRAEPLPATVPGDRASAWITDQLLLIERPTADCPRHAFPQLCSQVVLLAPRGRRRRPAR